MKIKLLYPRLVWQNKFIGGAWGEPWKQKSIEFNTKISYTVNDEDDFTFIIQILGFGFLVYSNIWD